jgi:N-hydroxyarylamine O-acetyltransferase
VEGAVESTDNSAFELDAYLRRIDYSGALALNGETLTGLHLAHGTHIPFENVDVFLGRPIRLDLASLQTKLVRNKRGGYCFEHNTLFAAALETIGFRVTRLAARVRAGTDRMLPRTHMLLEVAADDRAFLADVGFGAGCPLLPIPFSRGVVANQFGWSFRLVEEAGLWVLQGGRPDAWSDLYAFTREPQYSVDFEVASYFTSTHPESIFVRTLTAQRQTVDLRYTLRNREFVADDASEEHRRIVNGANDLHNLLCTSFGLEFSPDVIEQVYRRLPSVS